MKKVPVALIFPHTPECLRLIVKEAVCRKGRTQVHDEVVYRAVPRVNEVGFVLEQFVNALDDVSFPQHDLVPHRHQFVLHLSLEPMNELDTLTEQALKEFLLDVSSISENLSKQDLCKHRPYPAVPVIHICSCKTERYHFTGIIA